VPTGSSVADGAKREAMYVKKPAAGRGTAMANGLIKLVVCRVPPTRGIITREGRKSRVWLVAHLAPPFTHGLA
jgi:hypothetical protein